MNEQKLTEIKSGILAFYAKGAGMPVLLQVDLADPVDLGLLQKAMDRAILRYPYFRVQVVWKDGDIYLADNDAPMIVEDSDQMRKLGSPETNYHLIEVHAHDHAIYLHFHHGIADGNGIFPLLRTLLYSYLCDFYHRDFVPGDSVNLPDSPVDPGEYAETIPDDFLPPLDEPVVTRPENLYAIPEFMPTKKESWFQTHISFPMKEFVHFMRSKDASPAIMLSIFMCQAVERVHPEHEEDIASELVWNYREEIGMPKTHNNCFHVLYLVYSDRVKKLPLDRQGTCFRGMTFAQTGEADAINVANQWIGLRKKLNELDGFDQKSAMMDFIGARPSQTFNISYTGQLDLGEAEEKIQDMHILTSGGIGVVMEVASVNETISIDLKTSEDIPTYLNAFCDILSEEGVHFKRSETFELTFPESVTSIAYDARDRDL